MCASKSDKLCDLEKCSKNFPRLDFIGPTFVPQI